MASRRNFTAMLVGAAFAAGVACPPRAPFAQVTTTYYSSGSGFFVNRQGQVVTNAHVLDKDCSGVELRLQGRTWPALIVAKDDKRDLAVVEARDYPGPVPLALREPEQPPRPGEPALALGFPEEYAQRGELKISPSTILKNDFPPLQGLMGGDHFVLFESAVKHGNSGGPLVDAEGNVLGVVQSNAELRIINPLNAQVESTRQMDRAIATGELAGFLREHRIAFETRHSQTTMDADLIRARLLPSVPNVRCILKGPLTDRRAPEILQGTFPQ